TNQTLTHLGIVNNNISDAGAKAIAEALKTNQTLTGLGIQNNNISDAGAKAIAEAVKKHKLLIAEDSISIDFRKVLFRFQVHAEHFEDVQAKRLKNLSDRVR
ncbi:unnamed protein product, partial [Didymodactylos carnosus]